MGKLSLDKNTKEALVLHDQIKRGRGWGMGGQLTLINLIDFCHTSPFQIPGGGRRKEGMLGRFFSAHPFTSQH